jgi:hypothetical protein
MGLLKSANNVPGVDYIDYRDQSYYNKYNYRVRVTVEGLRRGYYSDPDEFEERLLTNKLWGRIGKEEMAQIKQNLPEIKSILQFRSDHRKDKKLTMRMEYNTMSVFHNDLDFLHKHFDGLVGAKVDYTEVETTGYAGVKTFVNEPKYKFRIYFKSKRTPDDFKDGLKKLLETNKQLKTSPALKHWLRDTSNRGYWWSGYMSSHYFIDYNDESYLSYLSLMYGEYLGKKYKLQKRPDVV